MDVGGGGGERASTHPPWLSSSSPARPPRGTHPPCVRSQRTPTGWRGDDGLSLFGARKRAPNRGAHPPYRIPTGRVGGAGAGGDTQWTLEERGGLSALDSDSDDTRACFRAGPPGRAEDRSRRPAGTRGKCAAAGLACRRAGCYNNNYLTTPKVAIPMQYCKWIVQRRTLVVIRFPPMWVIGIRGTA